MLDMETEGPTKSSAIPLPSEWSDSNEDAGQQQGLEGGGGGGWDTSSDEGGGGVQKGVMRDFERVSAENTRRALLENDHLLCQDVESDTEDGKDDSPDRMKDATGFGSSVPQRFVPGDPFANEEPDVSAWARHFTYLSVVPTASWSTTARPAGEREEGEGAENGAAAAASVPFLEAVDGFHALDSTTSASGVTFTAAMKPSAHGVVGEQREGVDAGSGGDGGDPIVVGRAIDTIALRERPAARGWTREREEAQRGEEVREEVFASHGVYEEYLAYDCRRPSPNIDDVNKNPTEEQEADVDGKNALLKNIGDLGGFRGLPKTNRDTSIAAIHSSPESPREEVNSCFNFSEQQRELREELMDRLFDEMWRHLTPDLVLAANQVNLAEKPKNLALEVDVGGRREPAGTKQEAKERDSMVL